MNKDLLRNLLNNVKALEDAIRLVYHRPPQPTELFPYANYKMFARKYNEIAIQAHNELMGNVIFDIYDMDSFKHWADTVLPEQKVLFESVLGNVALLRSTLANAIDYQNEEVLNLKNFFVSNIRKATLKDPENEQYVQDTIEQLLIGKGFSKGIDYDREVGRIKISHKEYKPDFIFPKLGLAVEVKLCKTKIKSKVIVDEINADIRAYSKAYPFLLFILYDMGTIRDEDEYKNDLDNNQNIQLIIIKH